MFKKILCPIDVDSFAEPQLKFARSFARTQGAGLIALHVIPVTMGLYDTVSLIELQKVADDFARDKVKKLCGSDVNPLFSRGVVEHQINTTARENNCDLIIMPTNGYLGFKKFLFGSIFQAVVARSETPVLALPPRFLKEEEHDFVKPSMILCAIDLEKGSAKLIDISERLASEFQASFNVMHTLDLQKELLEMLVPPRLTEFKEDVKAKILKENPIAARAGEIIIEKGPAYDQIPKQTVENNIGLVILGVSRKSPFRQRSTLYRTVAQLTVPALCIPVD